jgi:NitT/TauT family transport system permease protein
MADVTETPRLVLTKPALPPAFRMLLPSRMLVSIVVGLVIWEIAGRLSPPIVLVPFSAAVSVLGRDVLNGVLIRHAVVSLIELGVGLVIGSIFGLAGGLLSAVNRRVRDLADPWVSIIYSTPYAALAPLFVVWFGLGISSKAALVFLAVFVPVWLNTYSGVTSTDARLVDVMRSFGGTRLQILRWIILPWALPSLIVGMRLAFSRGFLAVIVGEFIAATEGLGYYISFAGRFFRTEELLAGVVVIAIITLLFVEALKRLQARIVPWWEEKSA